MRVWCSRWMLAVVAVLMFAPAARADPWTFSLDPSTGAILGAPGETIGWGYSVTNQSETNWLLLSALSADPFFNATPDASLFDLPAIAPGATFSLAFTAGSTGLFQITWDGNAPIGFTNAGTFILSAESWDNDPNLGGSFISLGPDRSADYSATVTSSEVTLVPEPSTLLLMATGVTFLLQRRYVRESARFR